jgi:hypothetical protein
MGNIVLDFHQHPKGLMAFMGDGASPWGRLIHELVQPS